MKRILLFCWLMITGSVQLVNSATIEVSKSGKCREIGIALAMAVEGDTVSVQAGHYSERSIDQ